MTRVLYLRNDGDPGAEVVQADLGNVDPVDVDLALHSFKDTEDSQSQGRLPSSCPPDDAHLQYGVKRVTKNYSFIRSLEFII